MLEGVYSVQEPHFWTLCSEVYIGTIKLEVASNADAKYILSQTHNIFTQVSQKSSIFTQLVKHIIYIYTSSMGAQWLSGRVLDSRPRGRGFERHCVVSLSKTH